MIEYMQCIFHSRTGDDLGQLLLYLLLVQIIPTEHFECWFHFVLASRLLSTRQITSNEVAIVDALLLRFCSKFQQLYGKEAVWPNIHMHCHLVNLRCICTRVTVVVLCVCMCVCYRASCYIPRLYIESQVPLGFLCCSQRM